ncbi:hypothetical protein CP532_5516 [Ophiocordyceps camponoti-leonardi (nom. inval.)]|nr:hypothetical protein CP532_5516 [Ophiocordyceps camponoti-leonardi (nom. inval.)]
MLSNDHAKVVLISRYNPKANAVVEIGHQGITGALAKLSKESGKWLKYLPQAPTRRPLGVYTLALGPWTYTDAVDLKNPGRIALAVGKLSQGLTNFGPQHLSTAMQVLQYINHTEDLSVTFNGHDDEIVAMSDSSSGDNADRKSTYSFVIHVFGGIEAFKSGKQDTVITSSTEAELLALSHVVKEVRAFERLCRQVGFEPSDQQTRIRYDNLQTIRLVIDETPKLKTKLLHVDIHSHWLRQSPLSSTCCIQLAWRPNPTFRVCRRLRDARVRQHP